MQTRGITCNVFNIQPSRTFISVFEILSKLKKKREKNIRNIKKKLHEFVKRESGTKRVLTVR